MVVKALKPNADHHTAVGCTFSLGKSKATRQELPQEVSFTLVLENTAILFSFSNIHLSCSVLNPPLPIYIHLVPLLLQSPSNKDQLSGPQNCLQAVYFSEN